MVSAISASSRFDSALLQKAETGATRQPTSEELEVRETFQKSIGGTFYRQMLKALRSTQEKPAYFHGGQAEEVFQSQMDDRISEDMARRHGATIAGPLFEAYMRNRSK